MLKLLLAEAGMSQADLARASKVDRKTVSRIILGQRPPPPRDVERIADVLGLYGDRRARLIDRAMVAHLPQEYRARWFALLARVEQRESAR